MLCIKCLRNVLLTFLLYFNSGSLSNFFNKEDVCILTQSALKTKTNVH